MIKEENEESSDADQLQQQADWVPDNLGEHDKMKERFNKRMRNLNEEMEAEDMLRLHDQQVTMLQVDPSPYQSGKPKDEPNKRLSVISDDHSQSKPPK